MQTRFDVRLELAEDCDQNEPSRLYVIVAERDGAGRQEGDIWIPIEALPALITDLQACLAPMNLAA